MWTYIAVASLLLLLLLLLCTIALRSWYRYVAFAGERHIYLALGKMCKNCKHIHEVKYPGYRRIYAPSEGITWETDLFGTVYNARTIVFPPPTKDVDKEAEYCLAISEDVVWNVAKLPDKIAINRGPIVLNRGTIKFRKPDLNQLHEAVKY